MPADPKSWFPNLPWAKPKEAAPLVLKKRRTRAARPVPPPPSGPGPMDAMREGDRLKKLGLVREALRAYRAAVEKFLAEGKTTHARSAVKVALEIAPADRDLVSLLAELEERKAESSPRAAIARIALVPAPVPAAEPPFVPVPVAPADAPVTATTPRPPTEDERRLGLVPLALGEELMGEDAFDPATGTISIPSFTIPPAANDDEEMYLDLEPVLLEQQRNGFDLTPPRPEEPVAFFEDPEAENEKPTKVLG